MLIAAGTVLEGKYRVAKLLGAGGMGSVWIAEHTMLQRMVAVKILDSSAKKDATAIQRFVREAQTAARLRSDHIVDVLDVGRFDDGTPFLVMELLEGETLSARIKRLGRLTQHEAALFVDQLLDGLGAAHAAGVIHRDIKPDNCFITMKNGRDHLKLLDFGISKVAGDPREMRMTKTGVVMGTPYYMAPEQARGAKEIDHRCDLYAAGAILYECVTGRVPFDAESVNELLFKIVLEPLTPPRSLVHDLAPDFEQLVLHAMARESVDRFQTAQSFRDALGAWILPRSRPSGTVMQTPSGISSGPRVIVQHSSNPPPGMPPGTPVEVVSAVGATAPIPSNPISGPIGSYPTPSGQAPMTATARGHAAPATTPQYTPHPGNPGLEPPTRATPSGLLGMSATGPIHPSSPSPRRRSAGTVVAIGVTAIALLGGVAYVATRGDSTGRGRAAASSDVEAALPTGKTTEKATKPTKLPVEEATALVPVGTTTATAASTPTGATTEATAKSIATPTATTKKNKPVGSVTAKPTATTVTTGTATSPRPIDTSL